MDTKHLPRSVLFAAAIALAACGQNPELSPAPGALRVEGPGESAMAMDAGVRLTAQVQAWDADPGNLPDVMTPVRVEVFQTSKGRTIYNRAQRRAYLKSRSRSFNWSGLGSKGKRLSNGVYYVRFRTLDANKRLDSRRVVVERKKGRFAKKPGFYLVDRCR